MIVVISGTNREGSRTLRVAKTVTKILEDAGEEVELLDLAELPSSLFHPGAYASKPGELEPFQEAILKADGVLTVTPEYNGSFPGALKLFLDMLAFPDSLVEKPAGFVGLAAGRWGGLRAVEQLEMIFQYRSAHVFGKRVFIPAVQDVVGESGEMDDRELHGRLRTMAEGFADFCRRLC